MNCKIYNVGGADSTVATIGLSDESQVIAHVPYETPEDRANAEFIVRAVNSHDALVSACSELISALDDHIAIIGKDVGLPKSSVCPCASTTLRKARKAIALATGKGE